MHTTHISYVFTSAWINDGNVWTVLLRDAMQLHEAGTARCRAQLLPEHEARHHQILHVRVVPNIPVYDLAVKFLHTVTSRARE